MIYSNTLLYIKTVCISLMSNQKKWKLENLIWFNLMQLNNLKGVCKFLDEKYKRMKIKDFDLSYLNEIA